MRVLSLKETTLIGAGSGDDNFDLMLAVKNGAINGVYFAALLLVNLNLASVCGFIEFTSETAAATTVAGLLVYSVAAWVWEEVSSND